MPLFVHFGMYVIIYVIPYEICGMTLVRLFIIYSRILRNKLVCLELYIDC
jgi:hypothetical protein